MLNKRIVPVIKRRDPTLKEFEAAMEEFVKVCKANPEKDFLLLQVYACHGYHFAGFQEVLGPFFNKDTLKQELIPVEKLIREYL